MELFQANHYRSYRVVSCRTIADAFKTDGEYALHIFSRPFPAPSHASTFFHDTLGLCLDDLSTEGIKRNFGDQVNTIAEIILNRYDKKLPHYLTHLTTNLTAGEIEQCYSERARSRMREMFNMLILGGGDRRK
ncbi:hypothetical protein [Chitinophaga varians]|uniref:hypothetical protein n=1 Tax=Chitinophaga varians TaxID=2202339 RepID=UPI001CB728E3|nr:hypothetical protein [Chitinophaga varians]